MAETLGFIGLGAMGGPMAKRVLAGGFPLVVYDQSARQWQLWLKLGPSRKLNQRRRRPS